MLVLVLVLVLVLGLVLVLALGLVLVLGLGLGLGSGLGLGLGLPLPVDDGHVEVVGLRGEGGAVGGEQEGLEEERGRAVPARREGWRWAVGGEGGR